MKKETDLSIILISVLYLILGIIFLVATEELIKAVNYALVSLCAFIGVIQLIQFFLRKKYKNNNYSELLLAVVFIWVALVLYVYYGFMINILPILFSLYLFVMACEMISKYIQLKNLINVKRGKYLFLSLLAIIIGLLLIFNPGRLIYTYLKVTGVYLIFVSIVTFIEYKNNAK